MQESIKTKILNLIHDKLLIEKITSLGYIVLKERCYFHIYARSFQGFHHSHSQIETEIEEQLNEYKD